MSADNGFVVAHIENKMDQYGVFYYQGGYNAGVDRSAEAARSIWLNPVEAMIAAHKCQQYEMTEYGVYVTPQVLYDAESQQNRLVESYLRHGRG